MNYEPTTFIFFFEYQQINVRLFSTWVSSNNTLNEAQNYFRNKTSTDTAVQAYISKLQYATYMRTNLTQIFSDPPKSFDVINHRMLLWKLLSWHKRYNKLVVKIISTAHKYLTTNQCEGTNSVQMNLPSFPRRGLLRREHLLRLRLSQTPNTHKTEGLVF
jgi:hypothetical protein